MEIGLYVSGAVFVVSLIAGKFRDDALLDIVVVVSAISALVFGLGMRP